MTGARQKINNSPYILFFICGLRLGAQTSLGSCAVAACGMVVVFSNGHGHAFCARVGLLVIYII